MEAEGEGPIRAREASFSGGIKGDGEDGVGAGGAMPIGDAGDQLKALSTGSGRCSKRSPFCRGRGGNARGTGSEGGRRDGGHWR